MSDIKFTTTTYKKSKFELIPFRNSNREIPRNEAYFDWRYINRPHGLNPIIVWAETGGGEKIGALSLIPQMYSIYNKVSPLGMIGDISISKEWRGKGIAQKMFDYLSALEEVKAFKACIVLPNEDAARPLEKAGWRTISKLERYIKIIDVEHNLARWLTSRRVSKICALPFNYLLKYLSYETFLKDVADLKGEIVSGFDERFDDLWNSVKKEEVVIGLRDRESLTWRYSRHPDIKYQFFTLTYQERLCGYVIFYVGQDECFVIDFLYLNQNNHSILLLYYFLKYIRKNNIAGTISIKINQNDLFSLSLNRFGFIRRPDYLKFMVKSQNVGEEEAILNGNSWYITAGDKDV